MTSKPFPVPLLHSNLRRLPWRYRMTLCVAAACQDRGKPRIVIATDWRAETGNAGGDIQDKLFWINDRIGVLVAGTVSRAVELRNTYKQYFAKLENEQKAKPEKDRELITEANVLDVFKFPLVVFKNKLANEYIGIKYGMTYDAFLGAISRKEIPESIAEKEINNIGRIDPDCSLIILFFLEKTPYILKVVDGELESCENFAAIGSGEDIANSVLFQREHESDSTLSKTIYRVYECMKLGAIAPGVGEEFTLDVLYPPGEKSEGIYGEWLNSKGKRFMEREFRNRGPKPFTKFPQLPTGCLRKDFE